MPGVVADLVQPLAAHGFRLIAQTMLASDVSKAAMAKMMVESSRIISRLRLGKRAIVPEMFYVGKWILGYGGAHQGRRF